MIGIGERKNGGVLSSWVFTTFSFYIILPNIVKNEIFNLNIVQFYIRKYYVFHTNYTEVIIVVSIRFSTRKCMCSFEVWLDWQRDIQNSTGHVIGIVVSMYLFKPFCNLRFSYKIDIDLLIELRSVKANIEMNLLVTFIM